MGVSETPVSVRHKVDVQKLCRCPWANYPLSSSSLGWKSGGSNDILMTTAECLVKRRLKRLKSGISAAF
ncbi:General transcription and DNA repair factor [Trichinella pseudospiralis]